MMSRIQQTNIPGSSIGVVDGRYHAKTRVLAPFFSEEALMKYRLIVEVEYLIALSSSHKVALRKFTPAEIKKLRRLCEQFDTNSYDQVKKFETITNHDVKAVEYYMRDKLSKTSLSDSLEWIHFALTSEDINNISYALIISDSLERVIIPAIDRVVSTLGGLAKKHKNLSMLARTHGQSASPTTFGKEINVFVARVKKRMLGLKSIMIEAKLNGATGNYSAHVTAYPSVDWPKFSHTFIESFNKGRSQKLKMNEVTTQIECHDSYVAVFDTLRSINTILIDLDQDMWRYISDDWIRQKPKHGEVGSSTMPHKINPINFENSEGNLSIANSMFEFYARKLPVSRLQRDLSDSVVERTFGTAFAHTYLGYESLLIGLEKIVVNEKAIRGALQSHPEVITEAIQTILRREGIDKSYEKLKGLSRGKSLSITEIHEYIDSLDISNKAKLELKRITPENYTGLAPLIASK